MNLVKIQIFCSLNASIKKTEKRTTYLKILPKYIVQIYPPNIYLTSDMFLEHVDVNNKEADKSIEWPKDLSWHFKMIYR